MDTSIVVSVVGLGVPVNRLVETIKQLPPFQKLDDQARWWAALALSMVFGVILAFLLQYNAFEALGSVPGVQYVITGLAIGAAANGWNSLIDAFQAILARLQGTTIAQSAPEKIVAAKGNG